LAQNWLHQVWVGQGSFYPEMLKLPFKTHALICSVIWPNFVLMKGKFHRDAESISSVSFGDLFEEPIARYYQSPLTKAVSFFRHQVFGYEPIQNPVSEHDSKA
jgi:hypothetical protein